MLVLSDSILRTYFRSKRTREREIPVQGQQFKDMLQVQNNKRKVIVFRYSSLTTLKYYIQKLIVIVAVLNIV